jgi:dihydrodipicolinate synthase/N-acetylneuraminate lyase
VQRSDVARKTYQKFSVAAAAGECADDTLIMVDGVAVDGAGRVAVWRRAVSSQICKVALFEAIQANDLAAARAANDRIYPLVQAFYRAPFLDMHNRMKVCLQLLGRIDAAVVRPPLMPLTSAEIEELKAALVASGLLPDA